MFASCGIDLITPGSDDDKDPTPGSGNPDICAPDYNGPDTDGDGLSDECEEALGFNKDNEDSDGDGIKDPFDFPKGPNGEDLIVDGQEPPKWWDNFITQFANKTRAGNTLAHHFLSEQKTRGSKLTFEKRNIYFIIQDGEGESQEANYGDSPGAGILKFCRSHPDDESLSTHPNFIYFSIKGDVQFCDTCIVKNETMDLCAKLSKDLTLSSFQAGQTIEINDFEWHIGRVNAGLFLPEIAYKKERKASKINITPKNLKSRNDGQEAWPSVFERTKVKFFSPFEIEGSTNPFDPETSGQPVDSTGFIYPPKYYKRSKQSFQSRENKGIIGLFQNVDPPESETPPTTPQDFTRLEIF